MSLQWQLFSYDVTLVTDLPSTETPTQWRIKEGGADWAVAQGPARPGGPQLGKNIKNILH